MNQEEKKNDDKKADITLPSFLTVISSCMVNENCGEPLDVSVSL